MNQPPIDNITDPHTLLAVIASNSERAVQSTAISRLAGLASDSKDAWVAPNYRFVHA